MSKLSKCLLGIAAIGGAVAGIAYYLKKSDSSEDEDYMEDFEDEDFDLDNDLKSASDREYVPLNTGNAEDDSKETTAESSDSSKEEHKETETPSEPSAEK